MCVVSHLLAEAPEASALTQAPLRPAPREGTDASLLPQRLSDGSPRDISPPEPIRHEGDAVFTPVIINAVMSHVWNVRRHQTQAELKTGNLV